MGGWSADGSSIVGWQHDTGNSTRVTVCLVADGTCRRLTEGQATRWSSGDGRLYFLRPAAAGAFNLWSIMPDGADERRLFSLGTFRAIDAFFDVSKQGDVVWAPYQPGDRQVWTAAVR